MKKNDKVAVRQPVITGVIVQTRYNESSEELEHLVDFDNLDERHNRWFLESELVATDE